MNNVFLAIFGIIMFGLGSIVTYVMTSSPSSSAPIATNQPVTTTLQNPNTPPIVNAVSAPVVAVAQSVKTKTFNTQQIAPEKARELVNSLSDSQLKDYIGRFVPSKDTELITDPRQFANRAIDELYSQNDNQPLQGQILLSNSSQMPSQSMDTSTLNKNQKIFAHLNTFGKVPLGANVFVKWVNRDTGEVLLFEKKLIVPNSDTNWVSFQPYNGWQVGSYDIRFYQFTSQLEPVAQLSYTINQVIE